MEIKEVEYVQAAIPCFIFLAVAEFAYSYYKTKTMNNAYFRLNDAVCSFSLGALMTLQGLYMKLYVLTPCYKYVFEHYRLWSVLPAASTNEDVDEP